MPDMNISLPDIKLPDMGNCDVCNNEPAVGVACVPGMPVSVAYGAACLAANAHPYGLLVANTALIGNYADSTEWWQEMIDATLAHLGKPREQFDADVAESSAEFEREIALADEKLETMAADRSPLEFHPAGCICPGCGGVTTQSRWTGGEPRG